MRPYPLRITFGGYVYLDSSDDCAAAALALDEYNYNDEVCVSRDFSPGFIADLCGAGFLVMSQLFPEKAAGQKDSSGASLSEEGGEIQAVLFPKHHLVRSCLFFSDLHIKKSIRSKLSRYELRFDSDFETVVENCVKTHGSGWLTAPLVQAIKSVRELPALKGSLRVRPASFALYREGVLVAGEFGIVAGRVYTSYSGYFEEENAGSAQMILTSRWLEENGFAFWDLGMPLPYKLTLGAREIGRREFIKAFWDARE
ncbi:MAG: GNAT family N-acetyltransferase [Treponema sp.]|jgi:Leu/Phe-tRNA-protein transferase|nr:GNAT family N-acetyltransferase [Treponema sp.]